jgi:hypothetical protein
MELPIRATYPWTLEISEGDTPIATELHRTREAAEEAMLSCADEGLECRIVPTKA